jgi:hypothetical protein
MRTPNQILKGVTLEEAQGVQPDPKVIPGLNKVLAKYGMELKDISGDGYWQLRGPNSPKSQYFWWGNPNTMFIQYEKGKFNVRTSNDSKGDSLGKLDTDFKAVKKIMTALSKAAPKMVDMK